LKIYYRRNGTEVQGAVNIKHFNDLNQYNEIEFLELDNVLNQLNLNNVLIVMQAVYAKMATNGEIYIHDLDAHAIANKVKFNHSSLEDFNNILFQQGTVSCLALYWIKIQLEQIGFKTIECGYGYANDFWIRMLK